MDIYCTNCQGKNEEIGEFYREWTGKGYSNEYMLLNTEHYVARDRDEDSKIVGCIQLTVIPDPFFQRRWGLIENVFVLPEYRKKGIAKKLMRHGETQAQGFGCAFLKLTSRKTEGIALYRSLGYEEGSSFRKELELS